VFSGLVEGRAEVLAFQPLRAGARLELGAPRLERAAPRWRPARGESIAVSGCCLTVSRVGRSGRTSYDLSRETLARTWFARLAPGRAVNLERAVRLADRLGGHLVSGHVDAVGRVARVEDSGDGGALVTFEVPRGFERWLLEKGSVTIDGVSLTIVAPRARRFRVALIPETLRKTTLGLARPGEPVHLEGDQLGKWVERLLEPRLRACERIPRQPRASRMRRG
jgi:riboflavin synthase